MRGVLHNWPADQARTILDNIKAAMEPGYSVLLIDEIVLPEVGASYVSTAMDLTMMGAFASMERTEAEWRALISEAGLELVRTYTYNALEHESVMDIRLPEGTRGGGV